MYQLLIFDWDGTLMDSAFKISNCIRAAAQDVGLAQPSHQQAQHIIGLGLSEAMSQLFPQQTAAVIKDLVEAYRHHWLVADKTEQQLFAGVRQGLQELSAEVMLAIATGKSRAGLNRAFAELDIESLFVTSRCADETRSKPHPQMLEEILEFTSIAPANSVMIGDTTYDMEMAGHAGIDGVGVSYGVHTSQALTASGANIVHHSFVDLFTWLRDGNLQQPFANDGSVLAEVVEGVAE